MSLSDTHDRYGRVTRVIHWLTALLILAAFPLGYVAHQMSLSIDDLTGQAQASLIARTATLFSVHKTLGVAVVFVSLFRIAWGIAQRRPGLIRGEHRAEALAAETVHYLLYTLLILVPVSGWIHHAASAGFAPILWPLGQGLPLVPQSESLSALASGLHWIFAWSLAGVLALHIGGALKHHVIDRDATLRRMWRGEAAAASPRQPGHAAPVATATLLLALIAALGVSLTPARPGVEAGQSPAPALAESPSGDWQVTEGSLGITVTQFGNTVEGSFADWTAAITFDPEAPAGPAGHVTVQVSVPSLTLGSVTSQALGTDFLSAEDHPTATFDAEILRQEDGSHLASGTLSLRGQQMP
ncbi:cytochrome b/b6 domain-containing protein, partial [Oceanicola sp. S124]|uniref:cytochrome b/b6 domain-containing protein n=1 Tax=Oceanicola sp. S124 TaxID=1042378 RepID=UPI00025599AD